MKRVYGDIRNNSAEIIILNLCGNRKAFEYSIIAANRAYYVVYLAKDGSYFRTLASDCEGGMFYSHPYEREMEKIEDKNSIMAKGFEASRQFCYDVEAENLREMREDYNKQAINIRRIAEKLENLPKMLNIGTFQGTTYELERSPIVIEEARNSTAISLRGGNFSISAVQYKKGIPYHFQIKTNKGYSVYLSSYIGKGGRILGKKARELAGEEFENFVREAYRLIKKENDLVSEIKNGNVSK